MNYSAEVRSVLEELERRKAAKEDPSDSCNGSGSAEHPDGPAPVCTHCLGQGVLLSEQEYRVLIEIAIKHPDDILDGDVIE